MIFSIPKAYWLIGDHETKAAIRFHREDNSAALCQLSGHVIATIERSNTGCGHKNVGRTDI
ncbi:MAG: hypothetical protein HOP23_07380 [Methylococcaceae bacterium]|nr:hypothetical protein [Methylococcaceae bacterium]